MHPHKSIGSREFFDELSKKYDELYVKDPAYAKIIESIAEKVSELKPDRILELGVGTGNLAKLILERHSPIVYVAMDSAKEMISAARNKLSGQTNVEFIGHDIRNLNDNAKSNCIVTNYTLHHLTNEEKIRLCQKVYDALKPGGVLIYGDMFVNHMGPKEDGIRIKDKIDIFTYRAMYYLKHVGFERMLLELEHIPPIIREEKEVHVTTDFWKENLEKAGFKDVKIIQHFNEMPCDKIIIAKKTSE